MTSTGVARLVVVVPSPNWPTVVRAPALRAAASQQRARVLLCPRPPRTRRRSIPRRPLASARTSRSPRLPSGSSSPLPQHFTPPLLISAQVCMSSGGHRCYAAAQPASRSREPFDSSCHRPPVWPDSFEPQHFRPPLLERAHIWRLPAATAVMPLDRPTTSTGVKRFVVVPSPSAPSMFRPQHLTAPLVVSAQVCDHPATTATTPLVRPLTSTGVGRNAAGVPSPIWPYLFEPQHLRPPPPVIAQAWLRPAATATTPLVRPPA